MSLLMKFISDIMVLISLAIKVAYIFECATAGLKYLALAIS